MRSYYWKMAFCLIYLLAMAFDLQANSFDTFGLGSRQMALGGAVCATASDFSSVYYNPAAVTQGKEQSLSLGYFATNPKLKIDDDYAEADHTNGPLLGTVTPIGKDKRILISSALFFPNWRILDLQIVSPTKKRFVMYSGRSQRILTYISSGFVISEKLSFGAGIQFLADSVLVSESNVLLPGKNDNYSTYHEKLKGTPKISPNFGILYKPNDRLRFGLAFRAEVYLELNVTFTNSLEAYGFIYDTPLKVKSYLFYQPHQGVIAGAYDITERTSMEIDLTYTDWSSYKDPRDNTTVNKPPDQIDPTFDPQFKLYPHPHFKDTIVPRIGLEHKLKPQVTIRGGYYFEKSPVPEQNGKFNELNFVDNDKHVICAGAGFSFKDPFNIWEKPINLDIHFQYHHLIKRKMDKDEPFEDYVSKGYIINSGFMLTYKF